MPGWVSTLNENGLPNPLGTCVSLGCGFGGLERDLLRRGLVREIDGYDLSDGAIAEARRLAAEQGFTSIRYQIVDLDRYTLPEGKFDAIFAHSSVHHVAALENLFENVRRALKRDGIFHLNEFVGPSRFQWTDDQLHLINEYLDSLPERLRLTPTGPKPRVTRPTIQQMLDMDPTEAVRSADIVEVLARDFDIVEERPYGGTLLHMGLAGIAQNFRTEVREDVQHLQRFMDIEDEMMAAGVIGSDFAVLTARPRTADRPGFRAKAAPAIRPLATRRLHPSTEFATFGIDLTVSRADTMLQNSDDHYVAVGKSALSIIERALGTTQPSAILDLPCGFGRVTRFLRARYPNAAITVSDLDEAGVAFAAQQFSARGVISVRDFRDLAIGDVYGLIWVGSLITHLPAEQTKQFLAAMARHLAQDGRLVVSSHGPSIIPALRDKGYGLTPEAAEHVIDSFKRTGFGYADYSGNEGLYGVAMSDQHYGISLTAEPWIRQALSEVGLELLDYEIHAWDNHHDILVAGNSR